jgi:hypothetical protein
MEGEESFDSSLLGYADEVVEERVADDDVIMIKGTKTTSAVGDFFNFDYSFFWILHISTLQPKCLKSLWIPISCIVTF